MKSEAVFLEFSTTYAGSGTQSVIWNEIRVSKARL